MSFHKETETLVKKAIQKEYENACNEWGEKYNSLHEGYAILKEEYEEAETKVYFCQNVLNWIWRATKEGDIPYIAECIGKMESDATLAMKELVQVVACCKKLKNTIKEG